MNGRLLFALQCCAPRTHSRRFFPIDFTVETGRRTKSEFRQSHFPSSFGADKIRNPILKLTEEGGLFSGRKNYEFHFWQAIGKIVDDNPGYVDERHIFSYGNPIIRQR